MSEYWSKRVGSNSIECTGRDRNTSSVATPWWDILARGRAPEIEIDRTGTGKISYRESKVRRIKDNGMKTRHNELAGGVNICF